MAFPDVCQTPVGTGQVPIPYPNIAQLSQATGVTDVSGKEVLVGPSGLHILLKDSSVSSSTGDEAGVGMGVSSGTIQGECKIVQASNSVKYGPDGLGLARFMDATTQNTENASGFVMAAFPTILVGD
jgi:hypothetical protein